MRYNSLKLIGERFFFRAVITFEYWHLLHLQTFSPRLASRGTVQIWWCIIRWRRTCGPRSLLLAFLGHSTSSWFPGSLRPHSTRFVLWSHLEIGVAKCFSEAGFSLRTNLLECALGSKVHLEFCCIGERVWKLVFSSTLLRGVQVYM